MYKNLFESTPSCYAILRGNEENPSLNGVVNFYKSVATGHAGLMVEVALEALPIASDDGPSFLGIHIHEVGDCTMDFANTGMHYNPDNTEHPHHIGDLPPVLNNNGYAYMTFFDSFLSIDTILGRSIILHEKRDDFTTQPSGDSGKKLACGVIVSNYI